MNHIISYTLKVWLTSIVLGLILNVFIFSFYNPNNAMNTEGLFLSVFIGTIVGLMFSSPSILIFLYAMNGVSKNASSVLIKKVYLSVVGVLLGILPFVIAYTTQQITATALKYSPIYVMVIIASIWIYKPFTEESKMKV